MRRRGESDSTAPGQDSFLDVVANLVGILIILVVVVGAHARVSWRDRESQKRTDEQLSSLEGEFDTARQEAFSREQHNLDIERRIREEQATTRLLAAQRQALLVQLEQARRELDTQISQADGQHQAVAALAGQVSSARQRLVSLQRELRVVRSTESTPTVIDHLPTPIARTVFGKEIHYRLLNDRLVRVPLDELVERMRAEWRVKADNLKNARQTVEMVGPVEGFRMQYRLALVDKLYQTPAGTLRREVPEFMGFILIANSDQLGEPVSAALEPTSEFRRTIDAVDPDETTVTIWVYPDGYEHFSRLKAWLYERGFVTAGWPLPHGQPIAGGPNGFRSTAQ